jgi:hypothetical protein
MISPVKGISSSLRKKNRKKNFDVGWELIEVAEKDKYWEPRENFFHDGEYGLPNVLCIIPSVMQKQWVRYDDAIDYVEENERWRADVDVNHVKVIQGGFHPWNGLYIDSRTGEWAGKDSLGAAFFRSTNDKTDQKTLNFLAKNCGFKSAAEAKKYMVPLVPQSVRCLCEYTKIFTAPKVVFQLKPILYVYWS